MERAIDAAIFGDAVEILRASVVPTSGQFLERNFVGSVAVTLLVLMKRKTASGQC